MSSIQHLKTLTTVCRHTQWKQRGFASTTASVQKQQQQYGEGFAPPKDSRDTVKPVHRRRHIATSIPSHLGNPAKASTETPISPKQQHREALRTTRHQYARELLQLQGQRDAAAATKRIENEERLQSLKQQLDLEKQQQVQHEKEVEAMLGTTPTTQTVKEEDLLQQQQRDQNRMNHDQKIRTARLRQLVKMYHATETFVTLDNLDSRIDTLLAHKESPPMYTLDELMLTPAAEADEIKTRKQLLNQVMGL